MTAITHGFFLFVFLGGLLAGLSGGLGFPLLRGGGF